jgi:hypothetical protein
VYEAAAPINTGVPRKSDAPYVARAYTPISIMTKPISNATPIPERALANCPSPLFAWLRALHDSPGAPGTTHMISMKSKFKRGSSTSRPSQGDNPASAARRTLIVIAIHRKGSDQTKIAHASQGGAGCRISTRAPSIGLRKCHGQNTEDVYIQMAVASTAYFNRIKAKPLAA